MKTKKHNPLVLIKVVPVTHHDLKKSNVFNKGKLFLSPLRFCFNLLGIYIGSRHEKYPLKTKVFALVYHFLWFMGTLGTILCLIELTSSFYIFSAIVKTISIFFWWIVFRSRHSIANLLRTMQKLQDRMGYTRSINLWLLRTFILILIVFVLTPGVNSVYDTVTANRRNNPCFNFFIPLPNKPVRVLAYLLIQVNHQVANWILSYLVAVLVIFCCIELNSLVRFFIKSIRNSFNENSFSTYEALFDTATLMEETFTLPCFVILLRLFMEFFRIFSLIFKFVKGKPEAVSFVNAGSYAFVTILLFVMMIFSADRMYSGYKKLQSKVMSNASFSKSRNFSRCFMKQISVKKEGITLTGWGIFEIKKKLLLATLASLITYGVLLQQLQQ